MSVLQAGREADARVGKALFGWEIVGVAEMWWDWPDQGHISGPDGDDPVYLSECRCERIRQVETKQAASMVSEGLFSRAEADKWLAGQEADRVHGHRRACLEGVPFFTSPDYNIKPVLDRLIELGYEPLMGFNADTGTWSVSLEKRARTRLETVSISSSSADEAGGTAVAIVLDTPGTTAETLPLALCSAAVEALEGTR